MQVHIDRDGERYGPYSIEEINAYLANGTLLPTDLAWQDGMTDWLPIDQVIGVVIPGIKAQSSEYSVSINPACTWCEAPTKPGQSACEVCGGILLPGGSPESQQEPIITLEEKSKYHTDSPDSYGKKDYSTPEMPTKADNLIWYGRRMWTAMEKGWKFVCGLIMALIVAGILFFKIPAEDRRTIIESVSGKNATTQPEGEGGLFPFETEKFVAARKKAAEKAAAEKATMKKRTPPEAFTNTLGMRFVPVPGSGVAFCIWETRVKDYAAYAAANEGVNVSWKNPTLSWRSGNGVVLRKGKFTQQDTHPVVKVNWNDANEFCAWLTRKEFDMMKIKGRQKYRLPTDAEWSVAVGLGQEEGVTPHEKNMGIEDVYPWGKDVSGRKGGGNYKNDPTHKDKFEYTSPVGIFSANKFGLHDMGGNVYEWCEDLHSPFFSLEGRSISSNLSPEHRVLRGASWDVGFFTHGGFLSSRRFGFLPDSRRPDCGFRVVLVSE